jgi:hypothetical protein
MKKIITFMLAATFACVCNMGYSQTITNKTTAVEEPTPANVLKWTGEVLPRMEQLSAKLEKMKPTNAKDIESKKTYLKALQILRNINTRGTKLTAAEARRHDTWFAGIVKTFYIDCQAIHGNVCCVDCHNHGILGIWCYANCFVAQIPGID